MHMQTYAKKELMAEMFAAATKGLSAQAQQLARKVAARAQSLPSLAAIKTTKLDGDDCAHKDTYTMIHGPFFVNIFLDAHCPCVCGRGVFVECGGGGGGMGGGVDEGRVAIHVF
jgi:hypothetical protein